MHIVGGLGGRYDAIINDDDDDDDDDDTKCVACAVQLLDNLPHGRIQNNDRQLHEIRLSHYKGIFDSDT